MSKTTQTRFRIVFSPAAQEDFDSLEAPIAQYFSQQLEKRAHNPFVHELDQPLKGIYKISARHLTGYKLMRLLYTVNADQIIILVVQVGSKNYELTRKIKSAIARKS